MLLAVVVLATSLVGCGCSKKEFTVTFDSNGGTSVEAQTVEKDGTATKPTDPTREGYIFAGWELNGEEFDFATAITSDITLEAVWTEIDEGTKYTVSFNVDGDIETVEVTMGDTVDKPKNPTKKGYDFKGWYLDGKRYDFATPVIKDITLVAEFEKAADEDGQTAVAKKYTVKFNSNGGSSVSSQTVTEGSTVKKPSNPTRDGYTFVEWQLNGKAYDFNSKVTSNITLTAKWEKKADVYTLSFKKYDSFTPAGTIQVLKNGTVIAFSELLDANGTYVGKYSSSEKGMLNANEYAYNKVAKVKLADGTIVEITK